MRKNSLGVLILALSLTLAACGGAEPAPTEKQNANASVKNQSPAENVKGEPTGVAAAEEEPTEKPGEPEEAVYKEVTSSIWVIGKLCWILLNSIKK